MKKNKNRIWHFVLEFRVWKQKENNLVRVAVNPRTGDGGNGGGADNDGSR